MNSHDALKVISQVLADDQVRVSSALMSHGVYPSVFVTALRVAVVALQEQINEMDDGK